MGVPESRIDVVKNSDELSGPGCNELEASAHMFHVPSANTLPRLIESVDHEAKTAKLDDVWMGDDASYTYPDWLCVRVKNMDGKRWKNPVKPEEPEE